MMYSNPRLQATIDHWPYGSLRTTALFSIEEKPGKGQRGIRVTINPRNGQPSKPKTLTFASAVRIVDGDDGKTYLLEKSHAFASITVMQSNMQFQQEYIPATDSRYSTLLTLFA